MAKSILAGKKGIIIPAALGLLALLLSYQYIHQKERDLGFLAEPVPVLVSVRDIPRMTRLDETLLEVRKVPRRFVQPGALGKVQEAVNQVTTAPILKGEQVLGTKLVSFGAETGLAIKVPKGKRGVTLATTDVTGVAGLIKPGNYVDVVGTFEFGDGQKSDRRTQTIFQNVLVLAVEQNLGPETMAARARTLAGSKGKEEPRARPIQRSGIGSKSNVTLAMTPEQAQGMVLAQEAGTITLALRSMFEKHQPEKLTPTSVKELLNVDKKVLYRPRPAWREVRGTTIGGR